MAVGDVLSKLMLGRAFTAEKGRITTFGRITWILFPSRAFAKMLQDIGKKNGADYLYKLGYDSGMDFAKEISSVLGLKIKAGRAVEEVVLSLTQFTGFGLVEILKWDVNKDGHHLIRIKVLNNPVVEHSKALYGKKSMACAFFRGVFSAHVDFETYAKNANFIEEKCMCKKGGTYCEWVTKW